MRNHPTPVPLVEHYTKHRPGYPGAMLDCLRRKLGLADSSVVADVGSGTGILSRMLLEQGFRVFGVEPNRRMRETAERLLSDYSRFMSINGAAEATGLEAASVDLVVAAQAFHWFRIGEARREFSRILGDGGRVALIWNRRRTEGAFGAAYEAMLRRYGTDYAAVDHRRSTTPEVLSGFFGPEGYETAGFPNEQALDREGFRGRLLSSSYVPMAGTRGHGPMLRELQRIFDEFQTGGTVTIEYETEVYSGSV